MIKIDFDAQKMSEALGVIKSFEYAIKTPVHINEVIKAANILITSEFISHMSNVALASPTKFKHMYEWRSNGDPNERLWKHVLRGAGANRIMTFEFKASKTSVPVAAPLRAVGVQQNHIFVWKATVMELGLPVRISPKLAKMLVFESKDIKNGASTTGSGFTANGLVYHRGSISIEHQGSAQMWHSFTTEFMQWMNSDRPREVLSTLLTPRFINTTKKTIFSEINRIARTRTKKVGFKAAGIDPSVVNRINESYRVDYIAGAATRRVMTDV